MAILGFHDADGTNDIPGDEELLSTSRFSLDSCTRLPGRHSVSPRPLIHTALACIRQLLTLRDIVIFLLLQVFRALEHRIRRKCGARVYIVCLPWI